jgi:hypothetical protein
MSAALMTSPKFEVYNGFTSFYRAHHNEIIGNRQTLLAKE